MAEEPGGVYFRVTFLCFRQEGEGMRTQHFKHREECEGLAVDFDLCCPGIDFSCAIKQDDFEKSKMAFVANYEDAIAEVERLTNHADGLDYALAVSSGIITGLIDSFFVGEWDFKSAKAWSNKKVNQMVIDFAKKDPEYEKFVSRKRSTDMKDLNRLDNAIQFLEGKYKLPGDADYQQFMSAGITHHTHHLDDFCHHPTFIGLICCILVQFSGSITYHPSSGAIRNIPVSVNEYGKFVGNDTWPKVFAGIINWFFNIAETMKNRKGHLMSDVAGSIGAAKNKRDGAGLPGTFLSTAKELSTLPCFRNTNFAENLRMAYQNGIGTGNKQVNLGAFNSLFDGASSKFDMRTEMAIGHELKRQEFPVILNEVIVRGVYFVRRFIMQMRVKESVFDLDWATLLPANNGTIVRMMTISTGTFTVVDIADAAIRAAVKSNGMPQAFASNFVLRVNFVGMGRFAVACSSEVVMAMRRDRMELAVSTGAVAYSALTGTKAISTIQQIEAKSRVRQETLEKSTKQLTSLKF